MPIVVRWRRASVVLPCVGTSRYIIYLVKEDVSWGNVHILFEATKMSYVNLCPFSPVEIFVTFSIIPSNTNGESNPLLYVYLKKTSFGFFH